MKTLDTHSNLETASQSHQGFEKEDIKVLGLSALGGALEFYDFMIFALVAPILSHLFFPESMGETWALVSTYGIFAIGYLARPAGGLFMAHLGDKFGRKVIFTWSLLIMAIPSFAIGLLPSFHQIGLLAPLLLLVFRMFQAIAMGSEVPAAWTFVAEQVSKNKVGFANGLLIAGTSIGILSASATILILYLFLEKDQLYTWGWRIPFLLGGALGIVAIIMRRQLSETPVFIAMRARKRLYQGIPLIEVWRSFKTVLIIGMGMNWFLTGMAAVVLLAITPLLEKYLHLEAYQATLWQMLGIFFQAIGCSTFGFLSDRWGVGRATLFGATLMGISSTLFYFGLGYFPVGLTLLVYITMTFSAGSGVVLGKLTMDFPAEIRLSGMAAIYNLSSALFGGISLPLVTFLGRYYAWGPWPYLITLTGLFAVLGGVYLKHIEKKKANYL